MTEVTITAWALTLAAIAALLALDWLLLGRRPHAVGFGEAVRWSLFYVTVAVLFGVVLGLTAGWTFGTQYFAGYIVEKSLSVDNLFVFVIIIGAFAVPAEQQAKALSIGIAVALGLRAVFIVLGAALLQTFAVMFLVFGVVLVVTAVQLYRHRDSDPDVQDNVVVAAARRALPIGNHYDGGRLVTQVAGRRVFTPLVLVLLAIGSSDLLFAFDSIPAVFGVTNHAFIVFAANAFALLGLRAMYFLVSGLLDRLVYLSTGLAAILGFIGVKLVLEFAHHVSPAIPEVSTLLSLTVIAGVLALTAVASLRAARRDPSRHAHAGTLRAERRGSDRTLVGAEGPGREPRGEQRERREQAEAAGDDAPVGLLHRR
jgi:tellurite resistance protein TerC